MHISTVMLYINGSTAEWFFKFENNGKLKVFPVAADKYK